MLSINLEITDMGIPEYCPFTAEKLEKWKEDEKEI